MNIKKLEKLAQQIEALPAKVFDMNYFARKTNSDLVYPTEFKEALEHPCGTTCCIAGYQQLSQNRCIANGVVYKYTKKRGIGEAIGTAEYLAKKELGLTSDQAYSLFYQFSWPMTKSGKSKFAATPKGAARRIRHLIKTGK